MAIPIQPIRTSNLSRRIFAHADGAQRREHSSWSSFRFSVGHCVVVCLVLLLSACTAPKEAATNERDPFLSYSGNVAYGLPKKDGIILDKQYFVILFDTTTLVPAWVSYRLTPEDLKGMAVRTDDFRVDPELPPGRRSELVDYRGSGYDRGHMAPAADFKRDAGAMSATFLLSNMAPQRPALNRGLWAQLEAEVRILAEDYGNLWVLTGGLYLDSLDRPSPAGVRIGPNQVAVPTHFFKVILCEHPDGTREMFAFVMANSAGALPGKTTDYLRSVDAVEMLSGLDFFSGLDDETEDRLESVVATSWVSE